MESIQLDAHIKGSYSRTGIGAENVLGMIFVNHRFAKLPGERGIKSGISADFGIIVQQIVKNVGLHPLQILNLRHIRRSGRSGGVKRFGSRSQRVQFVGFNQTDRGKGHVDDDCR